MVSVASTWADIAPIRKAGISPIVRMDWSASRPNIWVVSIRSRVFSISSNSDEVCLGSASLCEGDGPFLERLVTFFGTLHLLTNGISKPHPIN
uniref:Uncharacterized protein n=1 Tax=uncultured marine virus TaxID=186617 RepID=A0A0F7L7X6_9VIRU|nr:hypothetical protein [uncultured marine virus]